MAVTGVLVKLLTTFLPLIKEYITSSNKRKDILSLRTMTAWVIITLVLGTGCTLYLSEQAINNLTIHEPLIKQYNKLQQDYHKLEAERALLRKNLSECRDETHVALSMCGIPEPVKVVPTKEYVYDPKTHTMILTGEIKK